MSDIMIDMGEVLRKLTYALEPALDAGTVSPDEAQSIIIYLIQDPQLLHLFQYVHEKPAHDYFAGFDCLSTPGLSDFIHDLIDSDGESPIEWTRDLDIVKIHCLNRYIADERTLTQDANGDFIFTNRVGTVDTYLIIELPDK